jgi:hypothetical protein
MSGIANSRRRGRPSNPSIDDFQDPVIADIDSGNAPDDGGPEELENGKTDEMEAGNGIPSEIANMVQDLGINGDYRVSLFKIPEGKRKSELQASYSNRVPEVEEFASEFGGGDYILVFTWHQRMGKDSEKRQRRISISVGQHYNLIAKKKDMEKKREFQMENTLLPVVQTVENPLDILIKYQSLLPKQGSGMDTILPVIVSIMQQSNQQMVTMMQSNMQMIVQMSQGRKSNIEEIKELLEVTNMLGGNSKSASTTDLLITEGFSLLKEYAPVVKEAISKLNNPFLKGVAKRELLANPMIQDMLSDPAKKESFIEQVYTQGTAKEVDNALVNAGIITNEQRRAE